jgi:RHS repeat-associated protein
MRRLLSLLTLCLAVSFPAISQTVSIWSASATPALIDSDDGAPIEIGVKFRSDIPGFITGLRFYKASTNTGTHIGNLWSRSGTLLGSAYFTGETASGWQQVSFSSPIAILPNTTYIASYYAPVGHYSADTTAFATSGVDNPPLHALEDGADGPNGVYDYSSNGDFPSSSYNSTNYWVDVVFTSGHSVSGTITGLGGAGAIVTLTSASGSITTTADSSGNYTLSAALDGWSSVSASNTNAAFTPAVRNVMVTGANLTDINFTGSTLCPCYTIWQPSALPASVESDASSVETGVKFQADQDGYILGVRFYKAATNAGTHIANLWSMAGAGSLLATTTFNAESDSGWQQVMFANPVPVSANTPYVASYFAPQGHFSSTDRFFADAGVDSPPLHALINGATAPNGVFVYASTTTYPTSSYNARNYWVDVVYAQATGYSIAGAISGTGAAGTTLTLSGAASLTTQPDASGNYSFSGLADGTYTVTPVGTGGITFSPASQTVTINRGHALGINFTATIPTYTISGTISGGHGDSVALSGAATATATADSSGNYSFTGLANGNYVVTPGTVGYTISPASQSVTISGENIPGVNFTGTALTYTISGTISGGGGSTVNLTGTVNATTVADSAGKFSFAGLTSGSYSLVPAKSGMVFTPTSLTETLSGASVTTANFAVPASCPCNTIWQPDVTPGVADFWDDHSVELGVVFRADSDGYIAGIRFYKAPANSGIHQGNLWSSTGTLLGSATFSDESASGWQQVLFNTPVPVYANTLYIASYFAPAGHYSGNTEFFDASGVDTPPLHALQNGVYGPNGVYAYSTISTFPNATYNAANYWVDVVYTRSAVPAQSVSGACIYALNPTAQQSFFIAGNTNSSTGCSVVVESSASAAFKMGGMDTLELGNHAEVEVVGGWQLKGGSLLDTISNQTVQPVRISSPGDPLASLQAPTQGQIVSTGPASYSKSNAPPNNTLSPGVYCGGLTVGDTNGVQFTMSPGTYVIAGGGFDITSSAIVVGSGVTVYNTSSNGWGCSGTYNYIPISINGQAKVNLSAPTSGLLSGIVIFGDRNGCATPGTCQDKINGGATATFNGAIYLKSDQLVFNGNSSGGGCMAAVADMISLKGNATFGGSGCAINPISVSITPTAAALYEGQSQQFSATVSNTYSTAVTWSVIPGGVGTIDASGLYTAPTSIAAQQTVTVVATSQADSTKSASATITLFPPISVSVSPAAATVYAGQQQQFIATVANTSNTAVTWAISPAGIGTISAGGLYTAPAGITAQQTVTITATSQADSSKSASAVLTLSAQISVAVSPAAATLFGGQTQQLIATVTNSSNSAVTWSISPAGTGSINASGLYTAPASITSQQTVTVTATSQADNTKSASAIVTLSPPQCASNGYSYGRAIAIDHTKVRNTDQTNFPFLFSTTDPMLATVANGGHVASPNGYDVIFTSDPAGNNPLNYEIEEYNQATGQMIAWVRIPTLSHTANTTIYLFYGNPSVTGSQQNAAGVWNQNYLGVWHVPNGTQLSLGDSTSNANNATDNGALAATGQIDGGMSTDGTTHATIGTPADLANLGLGNATFSAWVKAPVNSNGGIIMAKDDADISSGWTLGLDDNNNVDFSVIFSGGDFYLPSSQPVPSNAWTYIVVTLSGSATQAQATIYINGVPSGSDSGGFGLSTDDSAQVAYLTNATYGDQAYAPLNGTADEFRISNTIRSADWIATEYSNQSSPSTFFNLSQEGVRLVEISPVSTMLYGSQSQQLTAAILNNCSSAVTWSLNPTGLGTISASGLYTAPATIANPQTVTVTATSASDLTLSSSVTVNLLPPVAVTVSPASTTLSNGAQQQQFTASVANASNTAVTWSISPAGTGAIDANGLYTAPSSFTTQQVVTVTGTSQLDPTQSGSATVTLTPSSLPPPVCTANGYSFRRAIVIDHTQVPNTDQANFPLLFNSTDPGFATTANGGHMANVNANDLIFSTDPAGQNLLNYELEKYNPVTGEIIAWIQIPNLSHSADTVLYTFYGNEAITSPQQNPTRVWDANYLGVWHVPNGTQLSLADSTSNGNNATDNGATATTGQIDGGMQTNGSTYATIGTPASLANLAQGNATFSAWVNNSTGRFGTIMGKNDANDTSGWAVGLTSNDNVFLDLGGFYDLSLKSAEALGSGTWSYVVVTLAGSASSTQATVYVNGLPNGTASGHQNQIADDSSQIAYLAFDSLYTYSLNGATDELRISNTARSADWIATEYNNQSSPSTFYQLYSENTQGAVPTSTTVYASQSAQLTMVNGCGTAAVTWSMPTGSPGTLTTGGFYTAPETIPAQQSLTVTATNQTDGSVAGTATIGLMPPISISLTPTTATLQSGQTQQFTATVVNTNHTGVKWSISPSNLGSISSAGLYTALAQICGPETVTVTATSQADPTVSTSATVTVNPPLPTVTVTITPSTAILLANQTQQFNASVAVINGVCGGLGSSTWSISPAGMGTVSSSGLYKAPASIPTQQTVIVTAIGQSDSVTATATATITLIPNPPTIAVEPATVTLTGGQSEQYVATVANSSNRAVTWSMSPTGYGTLSATGLYTTPPVVTSQQRITITAVSQAMPSLSATAVLTLTPTQCAAKAYSYVRPIMIDHTKVPNSDQANFPFYFAVTDSSLSSTVNGGHMASASGYDIEFSSDPAGLHALDYEVEQYNPVTGQIAAWIRVPNVSHSSNTVIYMFYGNPGVSAPQQNPAGVWDSNYAAVYQFDGVQPGSVADLTSNGNNAWSVDVQPAAGQPGGAGGFDGTSSFLLLPANDFASYPVSGASGAVFNSTFGVWFKTASQGVLLGQTGGGGPGSGFPGGWVPALYIDASGYLRASLFYFTNAQQIVSSTRFNDNNWHHAVVTFDINKTTNSVGVYGSIWSVTSGVETLYVDGQVVGSRSDAIPNAYSSGYSYFVGSGFTNGWGAGNYNWFYFNGNLDQIEISSMARSADWVRAEYLNQSSPSTFFTLGTEAGANPSVTPVAVTLYGAQSQQFTVLATGLCNADDAVWSMPAGSPGTLSPQGLYMAPQTVATPQTVTVTATTLGASSAPLTATVTLTPSVAISVRPAVTTLPAGGTQQFTATVTNTNNTGVTWTLLPAGVGSISATGLYTAPATITGQQTVTVTASSLADSTQWASATITLGSAAVPVPAVNLNPPAASLFAKQTQQFTATVTNTSNTAVTWSISPAGDGSIDANGLYTAPSTISSEETVTVKATSQADASQSASAPIKLATECMANGYGYSRQIVIDHTKIPNSDQANFPFLFSTTDPLLASTANGGHVANANGYDIIFSTDPNGLSKLNYEMEKYNPATGQVIAWVNIPNLSHTTNTVIYLSYGNANITTSQQNSTAVWGTSYQGVWHMPNGSTLTANDSTENEHNGSILGASAAVGAVDGGASFDGTSSYIDVGNMGTLPIQGTIEFWMNASDLSSYPNALTTNYNGDNDAIRFEEDSTGDFGVAIGSGSFTFTGYSLLSHSLQPNTWYHVALSWNTATSDAIGFINGTQVFNSSTSTLWPASIADLAFGTGYNTSRIWKGLLDEVRISSTARSSDWIATEYNNQSSPSSFYSLSAESAWGGITPQSVSLYASQGQQFAVPALCSSSVTWSLEQGTPGTLTPTGFYSAPDMIAAQQTVSITATSTSNPSQASTATVTLLPPVSTSISPTSVTLTENQTQLFTSVVNNSTNAAVIWSISPAGLGSVDPGGVYTAPASITTQETVTIIATSQADLTKSASAMVTLSPTQCASTGYGYQRLILIDHTKVATTDQINFPFLFNTTDPDLATMDNGGRVANPNGYDIIFSTDPNGQTKLDFEVEKYNPTTGQLVAWIRIPTLSHSSDTVIYVFYGNPSISTSQANPTGVWDNNYDAVYHLGNLPTTNIAADSTSNVNNAPFASLMAYNGLIDGGASLDGVESYLEIPATAFPSYPTGVYSNLGVNTTWNNTTFSATFGIWFKTASWGGLLDQTAGATCSAFCIFASPEQPGDNPDGSWGSMLDINFNGNLEGRGVDPTTQTYNDNNWHFAAITFESGVNKLYADGQLVGTGQQGAFGYAPNYAYFVGAADVETDTSSLDSRPWLYLDGAIDEIKVSNKARSGDWIQTEYNNQSSPATFYKFYAPSAIQVAPAAISLYAAQSEQFVVPGACDATIAWSMPTGSPGMLSITGLYTAPTSITSQQIVTVNATSHSSGASLGSAIVTLLPPPQPITLEPTSPSPYSVGSSQTFTVTLLDPQGDPQVDIPVSFTVAGVNEGAGSATTDINGVAFYTYTGANSGTDTVQATAGISGVLLTSNTVSATWLTPPPVQAPTVTLLPQPSLGRGALMGAFTDNNGSIIEPIPIGIAARTFITPAGATRLQLGINDNYFEDNGGAGFVVLVNGTSATVPPTAMPWKWKTGGLNNNYQYGVNDGTDPVVAGVSFTAGESVTIAYQSGTVSTDIPTRPLVNANGEPGFITGTQLLQGAYFPTLYTTGTSYPETQPITVFATVADATGAPIPNAQVTLEVSGANPGQYQATSDSTGSAAFLYTGANAGSDSLQAQATVTGIGALTSDLSTITWTYYPTPPPVGSLTLNYILSVVNAQYFSSYAKDASGNPLSNVNVGIYVTGVDNFQTSVTTSDTGQAYFSYYHTLSGSYSVIAVDSVDRNVIVTQPYTGNWVVPSSTQSGGSATLSVSISASAYVTLSNALQLNGTATDTSGLTPAVTWTQISGPGTVTFANPNQAVTTASFSQAGTYVLQLSATDALNSGSAQFTVTVVQPSVAYEAQGWIATPVYGSAVSGLVPITLASGVSLASGTLSYARTDNPNNVTVLNANVSGMGQIATLDTTTLGNGSYSIQMQATDTSGHAENSLVRVTVTGNYKPGRVTTTVTDLVVPSTGLAINVQRTYDSLNAGTSGDFGYGWSLGININLVVDPSGNVTFTLGGQRKTFYLTPHVPPCTFAGCLFPYYSVAFTPEPGLHGTLTDSSQGCPLDLVIPDGSLWYCQLGGGQYNPSGYIYTDPTGAQYTISASGALQSIYDRTGNGLTITPNGITSTTGLNVLFVRDSQNRITQITDPQGNLYVYGYDENGNLASVTYPNTSQPSTYTYDPNHYYLSGTDFRNNPLPSVQYYATGSTDADGNSLAGKMESVTDALGEKTSYAYDLSTNTTTITYPPDPSGAVGTAKMVYDSYGMLLSLTDPLGHTTTNVYDTKHNLTSATDPLGHTTAYTYDANGNQTSITYPQTSTSTNTTSTTAYNQYSEPTSTTDELGNMRTFAYDASFNPQSVKDANGTLASFIFNANGTLQAGAIGSDISSQPGKASQFTYDANGDLTGRTDALGRTTSYGYDTLGRKVSMTIPLPNSGTSAAAATTSYQYDALGNLTQTAAPLRRTASSQYDANGNKISDTDANGHTTTYQYDALNRLTTTTYPTQPVTTSSRTYDFRNNVIDESDQGGHVTHHVYDLAGRLTSVTRAYRTSNTATTAYSYDAAGRKVSETDPLGHITNSTYDAAGNLTAISGVNGSFQYGYDNARNRISVIDGNGNTTQYQYDVRKRLLTTTYPDSTTVSNAYDGPGNLINVTDQGGKVVQYTYDAANQLNSVVQTNAPDSSHNTTAYGYDRDGNLTGLTDANGHTTSNAFDLLYQLSSKTLPDGSLTESRSYDTVGNLLSLKHFNGYTTTYTYDGLNRPLTRVPDPNLGEPTVSFTYTPTGKRASMTDASGTTTYSYDSLDRLTMKTTPEGTLNYTYDAAGDLASMTSSDGNVSAAYTWDELNRLSAVVDHRLNGSNSTTYTYDSANNLATATYPNGIQSTFSYDTLNRLTGEASRIDNYSYQLGPTGNRTSVSEQGGRSVTWNYDGIYRLTTETISSDPTNHDGSVAYGLDPVGNRLSINSTLSGVNSGSFSFNGDDLMGGESYDADGNVTSTGGKNFTYDSDNQLKSMNGSAITLLYDGDGNRVAKTVNGVTTRYLVDDMNPTGYAQVVEETVNGSVQRAYSYGLQRIDVIQLVNSSWTLSFYGYDGSGSVRQLTDASGVVTDTYDYDAFGNKINSTGTTPNNYLYRGEFFDSDLGLYYLRARYMNPLTGRFMSRDPEESKIFDSNRKPVDPKMLHKYLYVGGDPINAKDPTGRDAIIEFALEQGDDEATVAELRVTGQVVREELLNECIELQNAIFEANDVPTPAAYSLAKALCIALLD